MTDSRGAPYYLLVGGAWKHLSAVAPAVPITPARPTSLFTALGNVVYAQVARVVKRTWGFSFEWEDPEATRWLDHAASRPELPVWLLDENLAQINMLPAAATEGVSSVTIDVGGVSMPAFTGYERHDTKLRGGQDYHLSYTTVAAEGVQVAWFETPSGDVTEIFAPPGVGARRGSMSIRPDEDTDIRLAWTLPGGMTTAARLTEGSVDDLGFLPSRGVTPCRVVVGDGAITYRMAWQDRLSLADSAYVLTEVG